MPSRKPLKCGAPRLLASHRGTSAKTYMAFYKALEKELGPFTPLVKLEAGRVALLWVQFKAAAESLTAAQDRRLYGTGRRPNVQQIERLSRRCGLADGSYAQALDKLRELAGRARVPTTPAALLTMTRKADGTGDR